MGIVLTASTAYNTQSNEVSEQMNCTFQKKVREMLENANVPYTYWGLTLNHVVTIHKCTISSAIKNITPQEALLGSATNSPRMCILGCAAYLHTDKEVSASK